MADILLEVCVDDIAGLTAACDGGADRIELCSALSVGGLTPSAGLMAAAAKMPVPSYAMIRPRTGDFVYNSAELALMAGDIDAARAAGLAGVVLGANRRDGSLDGDALASLVTQARGLGLTLHRAFDLVPDMADAIETAIALGFERILTSGGATSAAAGIDALASACEVAAGRISIMPGSGVTLATIDTLLARLPVREIHSSCSAPALDQDPRVLAFGFASATERRTDAGIVAALRARVSRR